MIKGGTKKLIKSLSNIFGFYFVPVIEHFSSLTFHFVISTRLRSLNKGLRNEIRMQTRNGFG